MTLEPQKAKKTFSGTVIIYGDYHNFSMGHRSEIDKRNRKNDPYDVHHYFKQIIRYSKEEKEKFGKIISNVDQMDKRFKMERRKTKYKPFYKAVYFKIYAFRRINED